MLTDYGLIGESLGLLIEAGGLNLGRGTRLGGVFRHPARLDSIANSDLKIQM